MKFVAGCIEDLQKAKEIIEKYDLVNKCNVYISPVYGNIDPRQIVQFLINNLMNEVRLQIQMHKVIWHPNQKGV